MALPSKAHIRLTPASVSGSAYEFLLDESIDTGSSVGNLYRPHYKLTYNSLFTPKVTIPGTNSKDSVRPERLIWFVDDFSGGENYRTWEPQDPSVYNYAFAINTRIKGQLTGRPSRTVTAVGANTETDGDVRDRPLLRISNNYVCLLGSNAVVAYSNSATTWTSLSTASIGGGTYYTGTDWKITAAAGNNQYLYYSLFRATTGTNTGSRVTIAVKGIGDSWTATSAVQSSASGKLPYGGLAWLQGFLYGWTGNTLWKLDVTDDTNFPLHNTTAGTYVTSLGSMSNDIPNTNVFGTKWWADCVATEHSIVCFFTTDGQSHVYEYDLNGKGFVEIWTPDPGFSIKAMKYSNGVVFMSGHWGGDSNQKGFGALYAMNINTRDITPICFARKQNALNLEMQEMCQSYGDTILVAASHTGRIWVYDAAMDAFSALDAMATSGSGTGAIEPSFPQVAATDVLAFVANDHRIGDMITHGPYRYAAIYRPGSATSTDAGYTSSTHSFRVVAYSDDEPSNRQAATTATDYVDYLYEGTWDFDVPFEQKLLYGFDVTYAPMTTGQSFFIEYSLDGASYVTATEYKSSDADAAKGRTFIDLTSVTSPLKFYQMSYRIGVKANGNGILPPIITGVAVEAEILAYDITFDLLIRLKDAQERTRAGTTATSGTGKRARDFLKTMRANKSPVTFLDGYVSSVPGVYDTYKVTVEDVEDVIVRAGEGTMKVMLRTIPT